MSSSVSVKCFFAGCLGYFIKPLFLGDTHTRLSRWLSAWADPSGLLHTFGLGFKRSTQHHGLREYTTHRPSSISFTFITLSHTHLLIGTHIWLGWPLDGTDGFQRTVHSSKGTPIVNVKCGRFYSWIVLAPSWTYTSTSP